MGGEGTKDRIRGERRKREKLFGQNDKKSAEMRGAKRRVGRRKRSDVFAGG